MITIIGKKFILFFITLAIVLSFGISAFASPPILPDCFKQIGQQIDTAMPFNPEHKYSCMQNPPDFSWPMMEEEGIKWDLIVCSDEELTDIKYSKYGLDYHYYNFPEAFEPGTYYWSVRVVNSDGNSEWSAPRRFRIDPDYTKYTPSASKDIVNRVPRNHPRIWMTEDTIDDFRNLQNSENGDKIVDMMLKKNEVHMTEGNPSEPTDITTATATAIDMGFRCQLAALCYILTGNAEIKDYAVKSMLEVSEWDINGVTSYENQDQAFFEILSRVSMAYDWMYNDMESEQITKIRTMLKARWDVIKDESLRILRKNPYNSHIWSYFGNYGIACMALVYDVNGMEEYFRQMLDLYLSNLVPMSTEDGGWSKGTAYWTYAFARDKQFMDILTLGGYVNCYDKAWARNEYLWAMYMMPSDSYGSFGDGSGEEKAGVSNYVAGLSKLGKYTENKIAYWLRNQIGTISQIRSSTVDSLLYADTMDEEGEAPYSYPNAHVFIDQGMAAMHSSITDDERISLYFRSGSYGSYNHMHADQNSFIIEAFGEKLATKSGYYDSYHSNHDTNFTRKTFAHNSITLDGIIGQTDDNIDAKGNIDMFLTHHDFDVAVGEAAGAYGDELDKFERSIIYVRPDVYIVIDDLKAANGKTHQFEWRLNAPPGTLSCIGENGAVIKNGDAVLDVQVVYPSVKTSGVIRSFVAPDGVVYAPQGDYEGYGPQDRMYFTTDKTEATKIITVMQVHKFDTQSKVLSSSEENGFITLTFDDGTSAIISTIEQSGQTSWQNMSFRGNAVVCNDSTVMLVGGDTLEIEGEPVISANRKISAVIGKSIVGVSSDDDANIRLGLSTSYFPENVSENSITDSKARPLSSLVGIEAQLEGGILDLQMQKGHYSLYMDKTAVSNPNELIPDNVRVMRDIANNTAKVYWDNNPKAYSYDICINGDLFKDVSMPYDFPIDNNSSYEVSVRAVGSAGASNLSEVVYLNPNREISVTNVKFVFKDSNGLKVTSPQKGGTVSAEVAVYNASGHNIALILAKYNKGQLVQALLQRANQQISGSYEQISTKTLNIDDDEDDFRAFIWDANELIPIAASASDIDGSVGLSAILIDGKELEGFSRDTLEYRVCLGDDGEMPVVKGEAEDNSAYVTCEYDVSSTQATATITVKASENNQRTYMVSFYLPEGCAQIIPLVSDFKNETDGMTYTEYCNYVGAPVKNESPTTKINACMECGIFKAGENLCGTSIQRKIVSVSQLSGFENCYFIAPDVSLYQTGSSAPWIVSAYTGTKQTDEKSGVTYDFSGYSKPWVTFKVNRACEVMVLSDSQPSFCTANKGWIHTEIEDELYEANRTVDSTVTKVDAFKNMYIKSYGKGAEVELCNENCAMNKNYMPYLTIIRFY